MLLRPIRTIALTLICFAGMAICASAAQEAAAQALPAAAAEGPIAALAAKIREIGLDPAECYRVRDLDFTREDARLYLTEGYLIFAKEVNGRRFAAVFVGEIDGGDAEILVFPPTRSERMSLAKFTESPNLNEHFRTAVFLFTDDSYAEILRAIAEKYAGRKVPEMGALYAEKYGELVKNLAESLELRLAKDLAEGPSTRQGFFYATFSGSRLGNFDFVLDPASRKGIRIGQFNLNQAQPLFDTWTQFAPRSVVSGQRPLPELDYRIEHYDMDATLSRDLSLKVRTRVRLVPLVQRSTIAMLISQNMDISSARAGEEVLEVYRPPSMRLNTIRRDQDTAFLLSTPKQAAVNQPIVIEMEHEGRVVQESGNDVYFVGARGSWFPGAGNRLATYNVVFRVPKGMDFVSTWETVEQSSDAETTTYRASVDKPVRTFGFNIGKYKRTTVRKNDFVVNVFANTQVETALEPKNRVMIVPSSVPPMGRRGGGGMTVTSMPSALPDPTDSLQALADKVAAMLTRLTAKFGQPAIQTVNVSPIPGHFGQGFAGMIYLSTISYIPESQRPSNVQDPASKTFYSNLLLPHELAHQWWGNLVFSETDQDEWLMEGLSNYTALLLLEEEKGKKEAAVVLQRYRDNLLASLGEGRIVDDAGPIHWGERLINSRDRGSWNTITYEKGTWIFHMLRARLGEERFFQMLRELPQRFAYKALSTEAFQKFAAEFVPPQSPDRNLEEFFAQWVESTGIPRIALTTAVTGAAPKVIVKANVKQSDVSEEFGALVPVVIRFARGPAETRWVRASNDGEDLEWTFRAVPSRIELDPEGLTLRRE